MITACLLALILVFAIVEPAYAYLDPGAISLAIQGLVAALAGAALTWKLWWWRLMSLLGVYKKVETEDEDEDEDEDEGGDETDADAEAEGAPEDSGDRADRG